MPNDFAKQAVIAFEEQIVPKFEDQLVFSETVDREEVGDTEMARSGDVKWFPVPQMAVSEDGIDATDHFNGITDQLVPVTLGYQKHVSRKMDAMELRDLMRKNRFGEAAALRLASDVNIAILRSICSWATLVDVKTGAAADWDDPARLDSIYNRIGVPQSGRHLAYTTGDYNKIAKDLAGRQTMTGKPTTAYERALIGENIAGFTAHKADYAITCPDATATGLTMDTRTSAGNFYKPKAKQSSADGESNVDNRRHTITVSAITNVNVGDWITIANVYEVHLVTKESTGELKTFRVMAKPSSTTLTISPPLISNQGLTQAEKDYQNCVVTSEASNAALTFLNVAAKSINPFWIKDAVKLVPARYAPPEGAGLMLSRATTKSGIEILMSMSGDIDNLNFKFRWDIFFGVGILRPDMIGAQLFNQV